MSKTILIAAGGTGGHIFPGLAAARELIDKGHRVVWLGSEGGMEARIVPANGISIHVIAVSGWRGQSLASWVSAPLRLLQALRAAYKVFRQEKPDCVLGMGGFAAGPAGIVAGLTRVPLVVHEQNAIPGMTNRMLAHLARKLLTGFRCAFEGHPRASWVGNPVRQDLFEIGAACSEPGTRTRLLVLGGSRGALALNEGVPEALAQLDDDLRPSVRHQAGQGKGEHCLQRYEALGVTAEVTEFIDDMASAYREADIVVARAGALTLAELAASGRGAILVPYPFAADDHQTANARDFEKAGAASVVPQGEGFVARLAEALKELVPNRMELQAMGRAANELARPDAAADVARNCLEVCRA